MFGETLLVASMVFIATSIDYLFLLIILFARVETQAQTRAVYIGQYIGTALLVGISLIIAYFLHFIPSEGLIGLLGLIPIYLGIKSALGYEEEVEAEEVERRLENKKSWYLVGVVASLTLASGGDNLGIYIPYFTASSSEKVGITLIVFAVLIFILCLLAQRVGQIKWVHQFLERFEHILIPLIFILLGIYILVENNTLTWLLTLMS